MHMIDFADDKRHYVNSFINMSKTFLIHAMDKLVNTCYKLLYFTGEELETDKCE